MTEQPAAKRIAIKMHKNDLFSQTLGIKLVEASPGKVTLRMNVRKDMTNGYDIGHGGVIFSLADSALAYASGTRGKRVLALETNISFVKKARPGDELTADAEELHLGNRTGVYSITIRNQNKDPVAHFRGTVYRSDKEIDIN